MTIHVLMEKSTAKIIHILAIFLISIHLYGEEKSFNYFYRIYFTDKGENHPGNYLPTDILSRKALDRRDKCGISALDYRDIPISDQYINMVRSLGLILHCKSKWMNTALFKSSEAFNTDILFDLHFVSEVKLVKHPEGKSAKTDKLDLSVKTDEFLDPDLHITMVNGQSLHPSGYTGKGILIAIPDAGFTNADRISSLSGLFERKGIKYTYNFLSNNPFVYGFHDHGTVVLSVLAGQVPGSLEGTAPGADYMLFITEDSESETPVEEDFWVAAAEFADSAGADIISSSLGYYVFDDPESNYEFSDLDGNTAFITRAADIAASKGILVFNSAGNERNKDWKRIIAPADGDSVIATGAVDRQMVISDFSSAGPSADSRVKPDISALGVNVLIQRSDTEISASSGTSLSCPVLSGMTACILQAAPEATNNEIIKALQASADRYISPDSLYGYGIPDMINVLRQLQEINLIKPEDITFARPNPTTGEVEIIFQQPPGKISIEIFTSSGILIWRREYSYYAGRNLVIPELDNQRQGIYFYRITTGTGSRLHKIIKTAR